MQAKILLSFKNPHIKIDLLLSPSRGQIPFKLLYSIMNLNTISLPWVRQGQQKSRSLHSVRTSNEAVLGIQVLHSPLIGPLFLEWSCSRSLPVLAGYVQVSQVISQGIHPGMGCLDWRAIWCEKNQWYPYLARLVFCKACRMHQWGGHLMMPTFARH
jgi:hypothetical protein